MGMLSALKDTEVSEILCVRGCATFSRRRKVFTTYRQTKGSVLNAVHLSPLPVRPEPVEGHLWFDKLTTNG